MENNIYFDNYEQVDSMIKLYIDNVIQPMIKNHTTKELQKVPILYSTGGVNSISSNNYKTLFKINDKLQLPIMFYNRNSDSVSSNQMVHRMDYAPNKPYNYYTEKIMDKRLKKYKFIRYELPVTIELSYDFKILSNYITDINMLKSMFLLHNNSYWNINTNVAPQYVKSLYCTFDSFSNSGGNEDKSKETIYESTFSLNVITNFVIKNRSIVNRNNVKTYINKTNIGVNISK